MFPPRARTAGLHLLCLPLIFVLGCAPYGKGMRPVLDQLARGDPGGALARLEDSAKEDDVLYQLERGLLLRLVGRLEESCRAFDDADRIAEDLFTRSITNEAVSLATTDRMRPYRPPAHELLLARFYQALNYLERGDLEGALVESRRIAQILDERRDSEDPGIERVAPVAHLLAGLIREAAGEPDAALVHYRRLFADAHASAQVLGRDPPEWLIRRCWRLAGAVGVDLTGELPEPYDGREPTPPRFTAVLFFEQGFVPPRLEARIDVPIFKKEAENDAAQLGPVIGTRGLAIHRDGWAAPRGAEIAYWLAIALPYYGPDPFVPAQPRISSGGRTAGADAFANVAGQARDQLAQEMPGIAARTAVRTITKYLAQREAKKQGGEIAGILTNVIGAATEQAETRTWLTLPHEISVAALDLPAAVDRLDLQWFGGERSEAFELVRIPDSDIGLCLFRTWR